MVMRFVLFLMLLGVASLRADVASDEAAWAAIEALDAAQPQRAQRAPTNAEEARQMMLSTLERKEAALRRFIAQHPASRKAGEAKIRVAHLLHTKGELLNQPALKQSAKGIIDAALASADEGTRADFVFARISLLMRDLDKPSEAEREGLRAQVTAFHTSYPADRRVAGLLAELATLYDARLEEKKALLDEALKLSTSEELNSRIQDDLKRIALVGKPLVIAGAGVNGEAIDTTAWRGKGVAVLFFARFSPPSLETLQALRRLEATLPKGKLAVVGVSLDPSPEGVRSVVDALKLTWPIVWDGKGWHSPLVRQLGVNALPTLWILNGDGVLQSLNATDDFEAQIKALLKL